MNYLYTVAGHTFKLLLPDDLSEVEWLVPYIPFEEKREVAFLFTLEIKKCTIASLQDVRRDMCRFNDEPPYLWLDNEGFMFASSMDEDSLGCLICAEKYYTIGTLYLPETSNAKFYFDNALKLLYILNTTTLNTLMLHASVVTQAGNGYAFLGKSGTGKSTHSQLWLRYLEGYELLNDDHPIIRLMDDEVIIYGSPWSGKTPCYKNKQARLKAVVRLEQASENKIIRLRGIQAYAAFSPSCSGMRWQREMADAIHQTIVAVTEHCRLLHLKCLPDEEAARLCCQTIHER